MGICKKKGGYLKVAKRKAVHIDKSSGEPNQKWHLLSSYVPKFDDNEEVSVIFRVKCPELLLWMAEAAGVDDEHVKKAQQQARDIIDAGINGRARNKAGAEIKNIIPWNTIIEKIKQSR